MYTHMERKRTSRTGGGQAENKISGPELWESEVAFGPHREVCPGEVYDSEDLIGTHKLLPIRKYGHGSNQNKSEKT